MQFQKKRIEAPKKYGMAMISYGYYWNLLEAFLADPENENIVALLSSASEILNDADLWEYYESSIVKEVIAILQVSKKDIHKDCLNVLAYDEEDDGEPVE